eukprot:CAMPEP_0202866458 /NCGR_PEP_ID=MMETSP1391-20130828/7599_1 /ASSEMBLY_ACC=CAM_ASM_000867 /TAXON_ID=1034604 /ORGANISM="Chlamydomonas leiostraca, Strain SAG 11-49" /LENGTH=197 /DNA_ID=CAMNT_0049546401 /DNA_START=64 /DNA_END=658 /DNA_ORIENTATION=+
MAKRNPEWWTQGRFQGIRSPEVINTTSRASTILPDFLRCKFGIHNGKTFVPLEVTEAMIGHRLGEFAPTRKIPVHKVKDKGIGAKKINPKTGKEGDTTRLRSCQSVMSVMSAMSASDLVWCNMRQCTYTGEVPVVLHTILGQDNALLVDGAWCVVHGCCDGAGSGERALPPDCQATTQSCRTTLQQAAYTAMFSGAR